MGRKKNAELRKETKIWFDADMNIVAEMSLYDYGQYFGYTIDELQDWIPEEHKNDLTKIQVKWQWPVVGTVQKFIFIPREKEIIK